MHLLDLAPELIDIIIDWSMPLGFEALCLSCKSIYVRAQTRIALHNKLRKRWRHWSNQTKRRGNTLHVLHEIAKEPLVAHYVERLDLHDRRRTIDYNADDPDVIFRHDPAALQRIADLIKRSRCLMDSVLDFEQWWEQIEAENRLSRSPQAMDWGLFTTMSLLYLLPNVRELRLSPRWAECKLRIRFKKEPHTQHEPFLDALTRRAHDPHFEGNSLAHLETVLPFMPAGYNVKAGFGEVGHFVLMPRVENVLLTSIVATDDRYTGIPFQWSSNLPEYVSGVRRLEFAYSAIDARTISTILSRMPHLEVFKYDHEYKWHGCLFEWNPGTFVEAIATHCGHSITDLAIICNDVECVENGIADFRAFRKLKALEIDLRALCGPPVSSGQRRGCYNDLLPEGSTPWNEKDLPCLASILPASIESLCILADDWDFAENSLRGASAVALRALLCGFRNSTLQHLDSVLIHMFEHESARSLVQSEGCIFEGWPQDIDRGYTRERYDHRSKLSPWIKEFIDNVGGIEFQ